jgi:phosphopantothenoylcysteine decarboxylase/phosphopantothenate--cysteine ligase
MNVRMWEHAATRANIATLEQRGVLFAGPTEGPMACGEYGEGRMVEPDEIVAAIERHFGANARLAGKKALVTSGPTFEPIDPVRFIGNRSSGKQGHAIAAALARAGAETVLVTGPTAERAPSGVSVLRVETAREMLQSCLSAFPVDVAVCAAAVADWRPADTSPRKVKKGGGRAPNITLVENPDILATLSTAGNRRPRLVVGFAAETENVVENAQSKRTKKKCDWIVANDVAPGTGTFGGDQNTVHLVTKTGVEEWPRMAKDGVAGRLVERIGDWFAADAEAAE